MLEAALAHLEKLRTQDEAEFDAMYEDLTGHYRHRLAALSGRDSDEKVTSRQHHKRFFRISRELLRVERCTAVRLRNDGHIDDEILRELERELDLREAGPARA
jgi:CPA1 family monovalent cation:H+ antiporter